MKIFCAQIVDEPENAPTLLLALSEGELLEKLRNDSDVRAVCGDAVEHYISAEEIAELYSEMHSDMYAGIFLEEQEL